MYKILGLVSALAGVWFLFVLHNEMRFPRHHSDPMKFVFAVAAFVASWFLFSHRDNPRQPVQESQAPQPQAAPFMSPSPVDSVFDEPVVRRQTVDTSEPPLRKPEPAWPQANASAPPSPFGSVFDDTVIRRQRADITTEKPPRISGRIREIRRWEDEAGLFGGKKKTLGFYLDYDRASKDFGNVLVRLRTSYFKMLKLQDGDELEIDLKWKRPWKYGYVACIKNVSSGQRVVPTSVSSKAGFLEGVESGTTRGAM